MSSRSIVHRITLPLKQLVLKSACHPIVGNYLSKKYGDLIPNRGCVIETSNPWVVPSMKAALYWGNYEKSEVLFVQRFLDGGLDVIDLGSSIGVVTSHIARKLTADERLISVEANEHLLSTIKSNVSRNAPEASLSVLHAAIDYSGQPEVLLDIGGRNVDSKVADVESDTTVMVPSTTLGQVWQQIDRRPFRLVADIEGAELGMIENESEALANCQQMIIELHHVYRDERQITPDEMASQIQKQGFELRGRRGDIFLFER